MYETAALAVVTFGGVDADIFWSAMTFAPLAGWGRNTGPILAELRLGSSRQAALPSHAVAGCEEWTGRASLSAGWRVKLSTQGSVDEPCDVVALQEQVEQEYGDDGDDDTSLKRPVVDLAVLPAAEIHEHDRERV